MTTHKTAATEPLDEALAAFIESRLSIQVASSDARGLATLARGYGAQVSPDRCRVRVLLACSQSDALLRDIEASGRIAVLFNEPESHRSVQLKGRDAQVEPATERDRAALPAYVDTLSRRLQHFQVPEAFSRALLSLADDDLVAVSFSPCEAYGQTPGPQAGEPLPAGAART
ncbi:pyridoxamine 5'-phosphate oxidase family protein [Marinobacterium aestuariivivens]|uniref:Pyridoxamine 5'-phosphate oxidase family protein n=1 Tax=Marinobacterium aestuariivivens TaxID=1698799 RepID=A0ABW2A6Y2_9GAMM